MTHEIAAEETPLLWDITDGVALLTLNRPDRGNSLSPALLQALTDAWVRVDADDSIQVVVLTGVGERHFCTGADVEGLEVGQGTLRNKPSTVVNRFSPRMAGVEKPVICAVNGLVNGGGLHFVADCDIVVASATSAFMDSHVSIGQVSALESQGVARRCGIGAALLLGLTGRGYRMSAERAFQIGLVDLLEPSPSETLERALELAAMIAGNSRRAVTLTKRAIWAIEEMHNPSCAEYGWELLKSNWQHPDFEEGPKAFAERRPPRWNPDPQARRPA